MSADNPERKLSVVSEENTDENNSSNHTGSLKHGSLVKKDDEIDLDNDLP